MIHRLWVKNFGPYEKASVNFNDFTVMIGMNGSGKSLLFTALKAIGRVAKYPLRSKTPQRHDGYPTRTGYVHFDDIVHRREVLRSVVLGVKFECKDIAGEYEVTLGHWQNPAGAVVAERLDVKATEGSIKIETTADGAVVGHIGQPMSRLRTPRLTSIPGLLFRSSDAKESAIGEKVQRALADRVAIYRFDPTALKAPAEVGKTLSPTGYNFATYLDQIRNEPGGKQEFDSLLERFRIACSHVDDILLPFEENPSAIGSPRKRLALQMAPGAPPIPADLESDGTILLLAYASLLHGSRTYETVCIEEPENGIHPKAISHQVEMLRQLTKIYKDRPGAQILVCTHSRPFFDQVKDQPDALRLVRRGVDGRSSVEAPSSSVISSLPTWAGLT